MDGNMASFILNIDNYDCAKVNDYSKLSHALMLQRDHSIYENKRKQ